LMVSTSRRGIPTAIRKVRHSSILGNCTARRPSAMPVRSLTSSVLVWPDVRVVDEAVRRWARRVASERPGVCRIGYFGSYARGDWGVGSDLDVIILLDREEASWERRAATWDATELPVPAEVFVYSVAEWDRLTVTSGFHRTVAGAAVWVYVREAAA
jgi:hypothetical protein